MNRLLFLALCSSIGIGAPAQSDTSHRFLWFTGHWSPTKKNTFVVTGATADGGSDAASSTGGLYAAGATTLTVENDGSVRINSPGIDEWNRWVHKATGSERQFIRQLEEPGDNLDPATHHLYQLILTDAQAEEEEINDLKIDPAQDILSPDTKPSQSTASSQANGSARSSLQQPTDDYCRQVKADYDEVIAWWKAHRHDKDADLTYAPPPGFEYNCYSCDSGLRKVYDATVDNYTRDFFHPEDHLIHKALAIMKAISFRSACSYMSTDDLATALGEIAYHAFRRADKMMMDNRKNFKAEAAIAQTWLKAARDYILITGAKNFANSGIAEIGSIIGKTIEYYTDQLRQNDWRQIGNIPLILNLLHDQAMVGSTDAGFRDLLTRLQKIWNGFKLTIEMDIKVGKNGGYEIEHLKGEGHIIPAFRQDSNQCYKWVMADENRVNNQGFYMASTSQALDCNLLDAEVITPADRPKYVGTKFYRTTLKSLSMDFCNPGHDTIMLTNMYPNPATAGQWVYPVGILNLGDNNIDEFFQSIADRKRLTDDGEAKQAAAQLKQQGEQLVAQMQALKSQLGGPQGAANYEKMMEMKNKAHALTTTSVAGKLLYIDFLLPVHNNNPVLVDKRFDAKEINPSENAVIVYGYYTIRIDNDANGRSKTPPTK
ncbi:MAG TPA: hypothetical protein VGQ51_05735 [Puia sp.]|jgi:hypothetical protein|nr:hypothetical protein [Puia sp.]